jgi:hypothetical protein
MGALAAAAEGRVELAAAGAGDELTADVDAGGSGVRLESHAPRQVRAVNKPVTIRPERSIGAA